MVILMDVAQSLVIITSNYIYSKLLILVSIVNNIPKPNKNAQNEPFVQKRG